MGGCQAKVIKKLSPALWQKTMAMTRKRIRCGLEVGNNKKADPRNKATNFSVSKQTLEMKVFSYNPILPLMPK